ncbi:MarR family transcriptional regulator [Catenovulum sp. 2E275]|uniref:MarR family winged helix-turn-helix transcriptional regulator n=1 Tax=Catenovulum sp. 2E275 TaxID=2980497 RepID=UPI0021D23CCE|nr:MarR family transcriptional regulator [Catenovulum sp. 2E275]MCU4675247.1 MarR family transcriptional regulator [Catenovulum sp. 2E275]
MKKETGIQESLMGLIHQYKKNIRHAVNARELGLTGMHVRVINILARLPKSEATANELVKLLGRDKAQIARLLKELIFNGLVTKQENPLDKRSQLLVLTEQGKQLTQTIKQAEQQILAQMQAGLTPEELSLFNQITLKMMNNLNR